MIAWLIHAQKCGIAGKAIIYSMYIVGNDFLEKGIKKPEMAGPNRVLQGYYISKSVVSFRIGE